MIFENGKYRHMVKGDTSNLGTWITAFIFVCILALPFWLIYKIISVLFSSSKPVEEKNTNSKKSYNGYPIN